MVDFKEKLQISWQAWQFKIASLFFLLGVFVFAVGLGLLVFRDSSGSDVKVISSEGDLGQSSDIVVDVGGAVSKPGVYSLKADSRVNDAVNAAGGLSAEADQSRLNLASKVTDGQKVFVPVKLEQVISDKGEVISQQNSSLISINSASESELDTLPGVGPVTAGKIINGRSYSSIDELVSKKAVTKSVFEKIKDQISI